MYQLRGNGVKTKQKWAEMKSTASEFNRQNNCFFSCLCCIIILYFYIYPNAVADPDTRILGDPDTRDPDAMCTLSMDENRLKAFEDMLAAILKQYDDTTEKMAELKAEGKEKTVTYRQLFASKLQLQAMLSYYRAYGLVDEEKKTEELQKV